jgi:hypothetical protein
MTRVSYINFYLASMVYYCSLTVQFGLIILTSYYVLSWEAFFGAIAVGLSPIPFEVVLTRYMQFYDTNKRVKNKLAMGLLARLE